MQMFNQVGQLVNAPLTTSGLAGSAIDKVEAAAGPVEISASPARDPNDIIVIGLVLLGLLLVLNL